MKCSAPVVICCVLGFADPAATAEKPAAGETPLIASVNREAARLAAQAHAIQIPQAVKTALVRVTAAMVVDLPGVARLDRSTMLGATMSSWDPDTVTFRAPDGSSRILIRPGHSIVGVVTGIDEQTVTLVRDDDSAVTIPRTAIASIERSRGKVSRGRASALGLLIGGGGGAGVGYLKGRSCTGFGCFLEPLASTLAGVILGGGGGAVVGALTPWERWTPVPASWLTASPILPQ